LAVAALYNRGRWIPSGGGSRGGSGAAGCRATRHVGTRSRTPSPSCCFSALPWRKEKWKVPSRVDFSAAADAGSNRIKDLVVFSCGGFFLMDSCGGCRCTYAVQYLISSVPVPPIATIFVFDWTNTIWTKRRITLHNGSAKKTKRWMQIDKSSRSGTPHVLVMLLVTARVTRVWFAERRQGKDLGSRVLAATFDLSNAIARGSVVWPSSLGLGLPIPQLKSSAT